MRTRTTRLDSAFISPLASVHEEGDSDDDKLYLRVQDDDEDAEEVRAPFNADIEYGDSFGYDLVVLLRGRTTGRRLKRSVFCLGFIQLAVGIAVIIMTDQAARTFEITDFFEKSVYGKRLLSLWWLSSIIGLILSFPHLFVVYYWPTVVSNRGLLMTFMRIIMLVQLVNWIFVLATVITTFRTFDEKRYFRGTFQDNKLLSYYLTSLFFLFPYLFCICNYTMNLSYLNDEIDYGGTVLEQDAPPDTWDLSGLTLEEVFRQTIAYPVAIIYQTIELIVAVYNLLRRIWARFLRYLDDRALAHEQELARQKAEKKKRRSFVQRLFKTAQKCCSYMTGGRRRDRDANVREKFAESEQQLRSAERSKEEAERMEKEREELEKERAYLREREARLAKEAAEAQAERDKVEKEEALRRRNEEEEKSPTLSVADFKEKWTSLPVAGQFQCKLMENPSLLAFTEHLRKQGFHIVFGATPSPNDVEVGVCNIRTSAEVPRFLGRFLSSQLSFSAVMKADEPEIVPEYVKKFGLAKVLKIDTTAAAKR